MNIVCLGRYVYDFDFLFSFSFCYCYSFSRYIPWHFLVIPSLVYFLVLHGGPVVSFRVVRFPSRPFSFLLLAHDKFNGIPLPQSIMLGCTQYLQ